MSDVSNETTTELCPGGHWGECEKQAPSTKEAHTCPYSTEMYNNYRSCRCCKHCEEDCYWSR